MSFITKHSRIYVSALLCLFAGPIHATTVDSVRMWRAEGYTRVVLDLDSPVRYNLVLASNPTRIILDLSVTELKASVAKLPLAATPIEIVRSSIVNGTDARLVFDLKRKVSPKSFLLKKLDGNSDRLVIDLYESTESANSQSTKNRNDAAKNNSAITDNEPVNIEALLASENAIKQDLKTTADDIAPVNGRSILITIDAGHGGVDSGALGPKGMREKDITLAIARTLARVINTQPGYTARLTRTGDNFVELQKRRDLARDMKADLFISIHADSFTDSTAYGASVFALSRKGATSEMARFLAQRENDSDLIGRVGGVSLDDKDAQLAGVLVDLSMTATVNSSLQVGSNVLSSISSIAPLHAKHVEQAGFVVLKSPDVPSILVETGFISNSGEAKKLASPDYREQMASAIFKGVRRYFAQHPPASANAASVNVASEKKSSKQLSKKDSAATNSAETKSTELKHLVVRGDTLTDIAVKYNVRASQIKIINNMKNDNVKLGQTLKIPAQ